MSEQRYTNGREPGGVRAMLQVLIMVIVGVWACETYAQGPNDRDMRLTEPTLTASGLPITNLLNCIVEITDATLLMETRTIVASAPTGGGGHDVILDGKIGLTNVESFCHNTLVEVGLRASRSRTFPGDIPAAPLLED